MAIPFHAGGLRNSTNGGWRTIRLRVIRKPGWWRRRPWVIEMDYLSNMFYDHDVFCSRHHTIDEANAKAKEMWADIEEDHQRIQRYIAEQAES